ncbi:hypothetical protein [Candidatus Cyanaurora vandensis]|uniref:hypothetical protein n=1 Tax=Candidatus Cyanaurora vandensis TaxID=2714958 RepID=UPI002579DF02|nr:hypothetical protein [Candidatus Cyanaurora vandensis]
MSGSQETMTDALAPPFQGQERVEQIIERVVQQQEQILGLVQNQQSQLEQLTTIIQRQQTQLELLQNEQVALWQRQKESDQRFQVLLDEMRYIVCQLPSPGNSQN